MQVIYCIAGLGADENIFRFLDLSFANTVFLYWITPLPNETLREYALRLKNEFIHEPDPIILGLSLGGMLAVEIAKSIPTAKAIIISSAKTRNEIPSYLKMLRYMPVYKILPRSSRKKFLNIQQYFLGAYSNLAKQYLLDAIEKADQKFYKWAVGAILTWQNQTVPLNIVHIHGTNDKLLPYKFVKADIPVNNAGHLMIIENASEISFLLRRVFNQWF